MSFIIYCFVLNILNVCNGMLNKLLFFVLHYLHSPGLYNLTPVDPSALSIKLLYEAYQSMKGNCCNMQQEQLHIHR